MKTVTIRGNVYMLSDDEAKRYRRAAADAREDVLQMLLEDYPRVPLDALAEERRDMETDIMEIWLTPYQVCS